MISARTGEPAERRRLRIALCLQELDPLGRALQGKPVPDGTYIVQASVATHLRARGHALTFVAPRDLDGVECTTDPTNPVAAARTWSASRGFDLARRGAWRVQRMVGLPYLNVFSNFTLFDACLRCLPGHDVVYERNGLYNGGVARACRRLGLPYVVFFEADQILELEVLGTPLTGLLRHRAVQLLRGNLEAADAIVCVSEPARTNLVANWRVAADKIAVIPNGVDPDRFKPCPRWREQARASLGLRAEPMVIFVGSFFRWHDVATLLAAFARVLVDHPDARLVLVGDGSHRVAMERQAAEAGIASSVTFTGLVPHGEVPRLLAASDVAVAPYPVLPQDLWLSPLKLLEYMAAGTALVATAAGQVRSIVRDGSNGVLVPAGDAVAMGAALARLIGDAAYRARLGGQARQDAVQEHSWDRYAQRLELVFDRVIARQPVGHV